MRHVLRRKWPVWAFLACWLPQVGGQPLESGRPVQQITIEHVGPAAVSNELIRANIQTKVGDQLSTVHINNDIKNLLSTGFFYTVNVKWDVTETGIDLIYSVQGKPILTEIIYQGNEKLRERSLRKKVTSEVGEPIDERKLFSDARELEALYEKKGYQNTKVEYDPTINEQRGRGTVTFKIEEAPRIRIERVDFKGTSAFKVKRLRRVIKTRRRWAFSWITGSGVLKQEQFAQDKETLRAFYWENGYIDFAIRDVTFEYPEENRMVIQFDIFEGNQYRVGDLTINGNEIFSTQEVLFTETKKGPRERLPMTSGEVFTPQGYADNRQAVEDLYENEGYLTTLNEGNTAVRPVQSANTETGTIDLEYQITEGDKSYIEKIEIRGNDKTKDKVIRRELAVSPGEPFNMVRARLSQTRLQGLNYFEKVDIRVEPTDISDRKNLIIGVEEKTTGNFIIGAGFNSVENLVGFIEFTQGNFDLFKPPLFQGGGQKLRLRTQVGTQRQDYQITFIEPWFLEQKLELETSLYHRELDFLSNEYDEVRTGGRVGLRKALGSDFVIGGVSYTLEKVGIVDVDPLASPIFKEEEGRRLVSKVGSTLSFDTRGGGFLPNTGQLTRVSTELAGGPFGADTDFYRLNLASKHYFKGLGTGHVLEVQGEIGVIEEYGDSDSVPLFDREYLGGLYSLRGFDFREVGPKAVDGEPIGGRTYWFGSAEYSIPLIERLRFAVFYDIGMVYEDAYSFDSYSYTDLQGRTVNTGSYNDNFGFGIRLNLPIGPLRLDYGIPITSDRENDSSGQFNFGVGWERPF